MVVLFAVWICGLRFLVYFQSAALYDGVLFSLAEFAGVHMQKRVQGSPSSWKLVSKQPSAQ